MRLVLVIIGLVILVIFGIGFIASKATYHSTNQWAQPTSITIDPTVQAFFELGAITGAVIMGAGLAAITPDRSEGD